jgi:hypothetical protein
MLRARMLTALSIVASTGPLAAQTPPAPQPSTRIRLRISADALAPIRLGPCGLVEGVDVSRGHGSNTAALRHCAHGTCQTYPGLDTRPVVVVFGGVVGGLIGAGLGAMVGRLIRTERWEEVAEPGLALGLDSGGGSVRLSLTIPLAPAW